MATRRKSWEPQFSSRGNMEFSVSGIVQNITEGDEEDYVKFLIDNPYAEGNTNSIEVHVPWERFPMLEEGQSVRIDGNIRSWWKKDIKSVVYSFHAEKVIIADEEDDSFVEEKKPKSRRG